MPPPPPLPPLTDSRGSPESHELIDLAQLEINETQTQLITTEESILKLLMPCDLANNMNIILEIRAGTGGEEASLFAYELLKMYEKYCQTQGWRWEIITMQRTEIGGFTSSQILISGENVFEQMKFESGVHRVQRIPINDTKIQTSAASVIVLPEASELDVQIKPNDLRVDVYRSSGNGGQSVNTTDSAVRLTHLPTGIVVAMQDERSQVQNKKKAMQVLLSRYPPPPHLPPLVPHLVLCRVYDHERAKASEERAELRSKAQGTGDRSDKIRTYNYPQVPLPLPPSHSSSLWSCRIASQTIGSGAR
jgi:peptide chain release factor 1